MGNTPLAGTHAKPRLLDQVRDRIRFKHYSIRTEQAYVDWTRRFILVHGKRHPEEMGAPEVEAFVTHLSTAGRVTASTRNQALSALLFLYREVLEIQLPWMENVQRAKRSQKLPVVLTTNEIPALLARMEGLDWLMASRLYGTGLRLMECVRLRVKDLDFEMKQIAVRSGKSCKDRVTMLPEPLIGPLREHLQRVRVIHEQDLRDGLGAVYLPHALERKYPKANREWGWQYVFPSRCDQSAGIRRLAHLCQSNSDSCVPARPGGRN